MQAIRERGDLETLRVITRSGSPIDLRDLAMVRPERARSIIVLAEEWERRRPHRMIG